MNLADIVMLIRSVYYEDEGNGEELRGSEIYLKNSILTEKEQDNIKVFLKTNEKTLKPMVERVIRFLNPDYKEDEF